MLCAHLALLSLLLTHASAALITSWENCLPDNILNSDPALLQWVPTFVNASFDRTAARGHGLNVTLYGNVKGQTIEGPYPPPDSPQWDNPNITFGKIVNISQTNKYTTLFQNYGILSYTSFASPGSPFCQATTNVECPIAPKFDANASDPSTYSAFSVGHQFFSSYAFSTIIVDVKVKSGDESALDIACVSAFVTPALGDTISNVLSYIPVAVLVFVAIATISAATLSPWGSSDVFRWTSNYGRDGDLLRLVTPGFGDCLQYIQFIVLSGSLSLAYPGYFQPVASQVSWSALMFNQSFVSGGDGRANPVDGIYVVSGSYGLTRMSQLVGLTGFKDLWAGAVIWALVILALAIVACQIGFAVRWARRKLAKDPAEDLRSKNWPFTGGILVRIVCNYFLLPLVSLSMFQLLTAKNSPAVVVAFAVILLVAILAFVGWIFRLILTTKPRSRLFDDLPLVLLYGPLYNTYSDGAAPFALIPTLLTFVRGIAIGAIQPSGIAQIVILAICEIVLILTLHAFRPFHSPTSMNAYHTFFSCFRLTVILLMVAFAPSLGVSEGSKGWVGYVILLFHAIVLIFGFFLNALQTIVEICARLGGAGGEDRTGRVTRGGLVKVLGSRQLSKRKRASYRASGHSEAAMLTDDGDAKSAQFGARSRSLSANSAIMLNSHRASDARMSQHMNRSISATTYGEPAPDGYSVLPTNGFGAARRPELNIKTGETADPYYRPPRPRRPTAELMTPGAKSRESRGSGDWADFSTSPDHGQSSSMGPHQIAPAPAYMKAREGSDANLHNPQQRSSVDYAVREVDLYYGMRGPALSSQPTRKLKTGPADPVGPVSSATGWFKGMFGGKKKDSGKGFEVVRSSRVPPRFAEDDELPKSPEEPYHDSPTAAEVYLPGERTRSGVEEDAAPTSGGKRILIDTDDEDDGDELVSPRPPSLAPINALGGFDLPSRWSSQVSRRLSGKHSTQDASNSVPLVPRKSSRRQASKEANEFAEPVSPVDLAMEAPEGVLSDRPTKAGAESAKLPAAMAPFRFPDQSTSYSSPSQGRAGDNVEWPLTSARPGQGGGSASRDGK